MPMAVRSPSDDVTGRQTVASARVTVLGAAPTKPSRIGDEGVSLSDEGCLSSKCEAIAKLSVSTHRPPKNTQMICSVLR